MGDAGCGFIATLDMKSGSVLLANMLETWLDAQPNFLAPTEVEDESQDLRGSPQQTGLHLHSPIDDRAGTASSGEHRAPVCPAPESTRTGLERNDDSDPRSGSGRIGHPDRGTGGLQDPSSRCFH